MNARLRGARGSRSVRATCRSGRARPILPVAEVVRPPPNPHHPPNHTTEVSRILRRGRSQSRLSRDFFRLDQNRRASLNPLVSGMPSRLDTIRCPPVRRTSSTSFPRKNALGVQLMSLFQRTESLDFRSRTSSSAMDESCSVTGPIPNSGSELWRALHWRVKWLVFGADFPQITRPKNGPPVSRHTHHRVHVK